MSYGWGMDVGNVGPRCLSPWGSWYGKGSIRIFGKKTMINTEVYLDVLGTLYAEDLASIFGGRPYIFMQDGAPSHRSKDAQQFCQENFCNGGSTFLSKNEWPPNSPDLNVMDYFCWGWMQEYVNSKKPKNRLELVVAVRESADALPLDFVRKAVDGWYKRVSLCVEEKGMQFKHRIKSQNAPAAPKRPDDQPVLDTLEIDQFGDVLRREDSGTGESDGSASE